jgi:Skp family chaperone for outer membrane proteins
MNKTCLMLLLSLGVASSLVIADQPVARPEQSKMNLTTAVRSDIKIAVVDTNQLVSKTQQGNEGRNKLEQKQVQLRQDIQREGQKIERASTEYNSKKSTMTDSARKEEETKLLRMRGDYERMVQAFEEELKLLASQEQELLIKAIVESAKEYALANRIDMVIDKASGSVIYSSDKADCTADLAKIMDKNYDQALQIAKNKEKETTQLAAKATGKKTA